MSNDIKSKKWNLRDTALILLLLLANALIVGILVEAFLSI